MTVFKDKSSTFLFTAALIAGLAIGFAGSTLAYRYRLLRVPGGYLVERMNRALSLTPTQREQVGDVMQETRQQMIELRHDMQQRRRRLMFDAYLKIRAVLNPDQQKKFDDEFVPPKFRTEARQSQQQDGTVGAKSSPTPEPSPAH
jgi:Spy/CpxP family protein refolding chaperone